MFDIGSCEGNNRSYASGYTITVLNENPDNNPYVYGPEPTQ